MSILIVYVINKVKFALKQMNKHSKEKFILSKNRYLVFCRVSDNSLHKEWLLPEESKNFDLFLEYYGDSEQKFANDCDFYSHYKPFTKYIRFFDLVSRNLINIYNYDAIWLSDDDISTNADNINKMFNIFSEYQLWLAQPALTHNSGIAHEITRVNPYYILRYTNFVEPMVPIFSSGALAQCFQTFNMSLSGWGLDFVWPKLLGYPTNKIAIIDSTPVFHTRTTGSGDIYRSINVDPHAELNRLVRKFRVKPFQFVQYGGVPAIG
jgi:hypothetical protein